MDSSISSHREQIDAIDRQLIELLNKRAVHAQAIGALKFKQDSKIPLYDAAREAKLMSALMKLNQGPLGKQHIHAIYREIISSCLQLEKQQNIMYLGPEGTFTHMAAQKHFGQAAQYSYRTTIADIFDAMVKKECDYAVVPIENSTEGMVSLTIDLLASKDLKIMGELETPIQHCLLGQSGTDTASIKEVHAHEQALAQCQHWLSQNLPHASLHKQSSNGIAVQMALNHSHTVAVGAEINAQLYNLSVLARNIEDIAGNKTRFVVLGRETVKRTGNDKTALLFAVPHKPGGLYRAIGAIAEEQVDMTRLESRPVKTSSWSYSFFAEIRGHIEDAAIQKTIHALETECTFVKFLGSFPSTSN